MNKMPRFFPFVCFLAVFAAAFPGAGFSQEKRPLTHNDYDSWKSISSQEISPDGNWILFIETPQKEEADLVVIDLKSGKEFRHAIGFTGEGTTAHS